MKPIDIQFVQNRNWRWVWAAAAVCTGLLIYGLIWRLVSIHSAQTETFGHIKVLNQQLQTLRSPNPPKVNPRQASLAQSAQLLQQDVNLIFAAVESLQEPGVRLHSLVLDNGTSILRLEYDLESLQKSSSVTTLLNLGHDQKPWQLESVTSNGATGAQSTAPTSIIKPTLSSTAFRGTWSVDLKKL